MYEFIGTITSGVPGKSEKGGSSQRRYERLREMKLNEYFTRVAEHAKKQFIDDRNIVGLVISGPGFTKDKFLRGNYLDYRLNKKIIAVMDIGYSGEDGFRETINKMSEQDIFQQNRTIFEKQLIDRFMKYVTSGRAVYGMNDVVHSIKKYKAQTIIASEEQNYNDLEELARQYGIDFQVISNKTESGQQFTSFGGIGAILKQL